MNIPPPPPGFQLETASPGRPPLSAPSTSASGNSAPLRPLSAEDGNNGYWDAKNTGNGYGQSFIVRNGVQTFVSDAQMQDIIANVGRVPDNFHGAPEGVDRTMAPPKSGLNQSAQPASSQGQMPPPPPGFELEAAQPGAYEDSLARASQMSQFSGGPTTRGRYNAALQRVRQEQFADMTDEQWAEYSGQMFAPDLNVLSQQGSTLGFGDEIGAGVGALGSQVRQWTGGGGPGFGEAFGSLQDLESARVALAREENGARGTAVELISGLGTGGPARTAVGALAPQVAQTGSRAAQFFRGLPPAAAGGATYGFGSTDGDLGQRATGAAVGAGLSLAGQAAAPIAGRLIQGTARRVAQVPVNMANRAATRQAVQSAPAASAIKATSQAAYRAAEATGAEISQPAMQILSHDVDQLARVSGLMMPDGSFSNAFPKAAQAVAALRQYASGPASIKEAQTVLKTLRAAQKSIDPDEARLGNMMVNQFEDFMDSLPPSAFSKNGQKGSEAVQQWAKGRTEWARSKRTQTIEDIISDARFARGGFANGVRTGFAKILKAKNAKARRGFSAADLEAMEDFVAGGPIQELLERIGSGAGLPGGIAGGLTGGPVGAIAVPAAGMLARGETNRQARKAVQQLRAQVATPGGIPMRSLPPPMLMPRGLGQLGGTAANVTSLDNVRNSIVPLPLPRPAYSR